MLLTDEQRTLLGPLFPAPPASPARGRPPIDDRLVLDAVLWKLATRCPWYDLPPAAPPHQTVYRRYRQWQRTGLFDRLLAILRHDLRTRGRFDLQTALASGDIAIGLVGRRLRVTAAPHLLGTWQLATALVVIARLEKDLNLCRTPTAASRCHQEFLALLAPPPAPGAGTTI